MATAAVIARILTQYSDVGSKAAQKDIARLEKKISAFGKKAVKSFALAGVATAAFAVKVGVDAVKGAAADEKALAALDTALRNNTSATDAAIAANAQYLDQLEIQVAIDNEKLIPALQQLATATGDLGQAQALLTLSTDVAAASGKDLSVVSAALSKAVNGNFTALTKLGLPLDADAVKAKDLGALLVQLANISKGQAAAATNTLAGRLEQIRLRFAQVADKLGIALMPAITMLAGYIENKVVPMLDLWITKQEIGLNQALESSVKNIIEVVEAFKDIYNVIAGINAIIPLGIGGWVKLLTAISAVSTAAGAAGLVLKQLKTLKIGYALGRGSAESAKALLAETSNIGKVTATIGIWSAKILDWAKRSKGFVALIIRGFAMISKAMLMTPWGRIITLVVALGYALKKLAERFNWFGQGKNKVVLSDMQNKNNKLMTEAASKTETMTQALERYQKTQEKNAGLTAEQIAQNKALAAINAKNAAADKKKAEQDAKVAALKKQIENKYKVKITDADEYEAIQLEAVKKLQEKQKDADASLKERLKMRKEELALFAALNANAQRYTDLLTALADNKLSDTEIALLAKKWGLTVDAAKSYIFTVFAIKDEKVDDDEVTKLAEAWGITKAQAQQYLEFFAALNDGKLSDTEIANLMKKWGLTKEEALKYADFISKIGDGKLDDKEIENLKTKWGLTTQQVVDYIVKIGGKVDASGSTILSAGDIAALGWTNALNALNAYLAALGTSSGGVPVIPKVVVPPVVVVPKVEDGLGGSKTDSAATAAAAASKKAADAYAAAKAKGDMDAAAKAAAGVTPSALAAGESGAIGAASIAAQLRAAEAARAAADAAAKQASSLAAFKAKEAADAAASKAAASQMDYDEKFRFRAAQGVMSASTDSGFKGLQGAGNTTVNLTVNGSVSTEQDLVSAVRNGLLRTQSNGNPLLLATV
jgi:hypothetical protein